MEKNYGSREIIQKLKKDGWVLSRIKGDHHQFKCSFKKGCITIQHPFKDLDRDVVNSVFKQAGWNNFSSPGRKIK